MKTCVIIPWFNYWRTSNKKEFSILINELKNKGYNAQLFDYEERPESLEDLLDKLNKFINNLPKSEIILIGFSLGSYLAVDYIQRYDSKKIKKIILCVPPIKGSQFFRVCFRLLPSYKKRTGNVVYEISHKRLDPSKTPKNIEIGIIRGTKRINRRLLVCLLAQLFLFGKKNDGLLAVKETDFGNFKKITLKIGHHDSPYNPLVINNIVSFIEKSDFI